MLDYSIASFDFIQASFTVASDHADIKLDDPDFWQKWAKKADIQIRDAKVCLTKIPILFESVATQLQLLTQCLEH